MSSLNNILKTNDLAIGYGKKIIAKNLNLELNRNELVCLLGQNGVGKSTLLRTLSNLQQSLYGSVNIDDQSIDSFSREKLSKKIGIVTTEKIGMPNMTVRDLVENAITKCGINFIADNKLSTLSDGQRQKAMIARVIAQNAEIIFLDEPTAHLDVVNRVEVMKLLSDLKAEKSILISTHELPLSMQFADKLWLMNFNDSMIVGKPEELLKSKALSDTYYHENFKIDFETGRVELK